VLTWGDDGFDGRGPAGGPVARAWEAVAELWAAAVFLVRLLLGR
jgi:hypothetical protein